VPKKYSAQDKRYCQGRQTDITNPKILYGMMNVRGRCSAHKGSQTRKDIKRKGGRRGE
jgi:hypothetical protein